jgi:hypothetical protein
VILPLQKMRYTIIQMSVTHPQKKVGEIKTIFRFLRKNLTLPVNRQSQTKRMAAERFRLKRAAPFRFK